jgi:hypothetical protein
MHAGKVIGGDVAPGRAIDADHPWQIIVAVEKRNPLQ